MTIKQNPTTHTSVVADTTDASTTIADAATHTVHASSSTHAGTTNSTNSTNTTDTDTTGTTGTSDSLLMLWWPISLLACMLFFTYAMTTDSVGQIIPEIIREFKVGTAHASAFHYSTMIGLAFGAIALGHLADRLGRKITLIGGLLLYALSCFLFMFGTAISFFVVLLFISGLAIGVLETTALALIGDITRTNEEHTRALNIVEGFYAVGAIAGPALVATLLSSDINWQYLYLSAAVLCLILLAHSLTIKYPPVRNSSRHRASAAQTIAMLSDPHARFFCVGIFLYVAIEAAIYVWMPTLFQNYVGGYYNAALYSLTIFFTLRAVGRFLGWWILRYFSWTAVMMWFTLFIFLCYCASLVFGIQVAVVLLPLSGLFMSMIYPTLNSKGISCFTKDRHSSVAGLILFFTAIAGASIAPVMAIIGDIFADGDIAAGFVLATIISALLFAMMAYNHLAQPIAQRLRETTAVQAVGAKELE